MRSVTCIKYHWVLPKTKLLWFLLQFSSPWCHASCVSEMQHKVCLVFPYIKGERRRVLSLGLKGKQWFFKHTPLPIFLVQAQRWGLRMVTYPTSYVDKWSVFERNKVNRTIIHHSLHHFQEYYQQQKQKLPCRAMSFSSRPFRNDLIARCSEAYVMKDVNIMPPTTIKPNRKNKAVIPKRQGKDGATMAKKAIPNP